jgi:hypothetical protein
MAIVPLRVQQAGTRDVDASGGIAALEDEGPHDSPQTAQRLLEPGVARAIALSLEGVMWWAELQGIGEAPSWLVGGLADGPAGGHLALCTGPTASGRSSALSAPM